MLNNIKPWVVEVYSDERMPDTYAAYASGTADEVEEAIGTAEEVMMYLIDQHVGNWCAEFDDDEEYEEWESTIGAHVSEVTDDDINDTEYMEWFNNLEVIYDERN